MSLLQWRKWVYSQTYSIGFLADMWVYCKQLEKEVSINPTPASTLHYNTLPTTALLANIIMFLFFINYNW